MSARSRRQRAAAAAPLAVALTLIGAVWAGGAVWSFEEQTALATSRGFAVPQLLPLVLDGLAVSIAGVAYAAALDGRPAVPARLMTALAVAASAASNAAWAASRSAGDELTIVLAAAVPVAANLAFEVLLRELRAQVQRHRGMPAPAAVAPPRLIRLLLAPRSTWREWRTAVLAATAPQATMPAAAAAPAMRLVHSVRSVDEVEPAAELDDVVDVDQAHDVDVDVEAAYAMVAEAAGGPGASAVLHSLPGPRPPAAAGRHLAPVDIPTDLLEIGRQVAADLAQRDERLTHRALMAGFRERGRSISSDRAGPVLRHLKAEADRSAPG